MRVGKNWTLWGLAGGAFGLVSSTCVLGLGQATAIPFSDQARAVLQMEWTLAAIAVILLVGGVFTWNLWLKSRREVTETRPPAPTGDRKPGKNSP